MTEKTVVQARRRWRTHDLLEAFEMWKRRRYLRRLLGEIARRGNGHLTRDIGMECPDTHRVALREREGARQHFWML